MPNTEASKGPAGHSSWWARLGDLRARGIGANVVALGLVSLFTDVSTEMVMAALPAWLIAQHGFSALGLGAVEGLWRGASALAAILAGFVADRFRRRKLVTFLGYGISGACKPLLLAAGGSWTLLSAILFCDRIGKGIRSAPRDALISLASEERVRATAFGLHRSLDTVGALAGPFLAFAILAAAPGRFDAVIVVAACAAGVGLGILALFVREPAADAKRPRPLRLRAAIAQPALRNLLIVAGLLGVLSIGEMQLLVVLERRGAVATQSLALWFGVLALVQLVLTLPLSRLADRIGRTGVFVAAHVLLIGAYATLAAPACDVAQPFLALALVGAFLAATEGVLSAAASVASAPEERSAAIAAVRGVSGLAKLLASVTFGALWAAWSAGVALLGFCVALFLAVLAGAILMRRTHATGTNP